jgi:predicted PurR-regulated permease PerM
VASDRRMQSTNLPLPSDRRWRRVLGVALFLGLLYAFRKLAPVFICFVILERTLGWAAEQLDKRTRIDRKGAIALLLAALASLLGLGIFVAIRRTLPLVAVIRTEGRDYLLSLFEHPSIVQLRAMIGLEGEALSGVIKAHAGEALHYATRTANLILFLLIGFVLAIIYLFEREEVERWYKGMSPDSVLGTITRWFGYVGDAIAVTVRMQAVVAVVNAVVTLPVLLLLGLPQIPLLFLLILITGLLPVVGNIISGTVLCYVAYTAKGAWAVGVFLGVTFVLHKIESYWLNPRLSAEHVKLPGLVLVISLLLFEQALGFVGLFLSFPALFVASKIGNEWRAADGAARAAAEAPSVNPPA